MRGWTRYFKGWFCLAAIAIGMVGRVPATERFWTGNAASPFWNVAGNWSNSVAPLAGDNLNFPSLQFTTYTTNNFPAGTTFGWIRISEGNLEQHVFGGNRITLTNGIALSSTRFALAPFVGFDITLGRGSIFSSTLGPGPNIGGTLNLNRQVFLVNTPGSMTFSGRVIDSGSVGSFGYMRMTNVGTVTIPSGGSYEVAANFAAEDASLYVSGGGHLRVDGTATNGGTVLIEVFGTNSMLSGTGIVDRVRAARDGIISPGGNAPGILTCKNLQLAWIVQSTLYWRGKLRMNLNGLTAGSEHDQLVTRQTTLGSPSQISGLLDVQVGYPAVIGDTFQIVQAPGEFDFVAGYFDGLAENALLETTNDYCLGIAYHGQKVVALTTLRTPESEFFLWQGNTNSGFSHNVNWSRGSNWVGQVAPTNGSHLRFSDYRMVFWSDVAELARVTNNLPQGTSLASMTFVGTNYIHPGYAVYGNALTITEGITNQAPVTNTCFLDLVPIGSMTLAAEAGAVLVLAGSFSGSGTLRKAGIGEVRYVGTTSNAFIGSILVTDGALRVDGSLTDGSLTVNAGSLTGTGMVSAVTMNGGDISGGASAGILRILGGLTMSAGATLRAELNGPVPGSGYDQLQVNGAVTLNGALLALQPGFSVQPGTSFLVLVNDGSDAIAGTFAGLPEGSIFLSGGQWFSISYHGGAGANDVVITGVTAPTRFANVVRVSPTTVRFVGAGPNSATYTIQANTNLATTNWLNLGTVSADPSGTFQFTDTNVHQFPLRFFRLRFP